MLETALVTDQVPAFLVADRDDRTRKVTDVQQVDEPAAGSRGEILEHPSRLEAVPDLGQGRPLARVDMELPSLTWYLDRIPEEIDLAQLDDLLKSDAGHLYVFDTRDWNRVSSEVQAKLRPVGHQGKYRVFELRPIEPDRARVDGVEPPG